MSAATHSCWLDARGPPAAPLLLAPVFVLVDVLASHRSSSIQALLLSPLDSTSCLLRLAWLAGLTAGHVIGR